MSAETTQDMNPGDEAEAGTPGTGESVCPICHGTGRILDEDDTVACANCGGSGVIIEGIGGG
jgi:DnaJ-class molecular chaperone